MGGLACVLAISTGGKASATSLTVPTTVPTIQEALDARPDTVLVSAGRYHETPVVTYPTVLIGIAGGTLGSRPVLDGLWFVPAGLGRTLQFATSNLECLGEVHIRNDETAFFEFSACRFGAGFFEFSAYLETGGLRFVGCEFEGEAWLAADGYVVLDSCVVRGNVIVGDQDCDLTIRRTHFLASGPGWAIAQRTSEIRSATIDSCTIENCEGGMYLNSYNSTIIRASVIRDCAGSGMVVGSQAVDIRENRVERCGGYGIYAISGSDTLKLLRNRVSECGEAGLSTGHDGIDVGIEDSAIIAENITWGNAGNGLVVGVFYSVGTVEVRNNTSVGNRKSGIVSNDTTDPLFFQSHRYVISNNIAAYNDTHGLSWVGPYVTSTGCNNWFLNGMSDVGGGAAAPTDVSTDPRFCDRLTGNLSLRANSQLLGMSECGLIGALGMGCDSMPTSVHVSRFTAERSGAAVRLTWEVSGGLASEDLWVERGEQVAGPWTRTDGKRTRQDGVVSQFDGSALAGKAYWYRLVGMAGGSPSVIAEPVWVDKAFVQAFRIESVGPNPSVGPIEIKFALPVSGLVTLEIFDIQGRSVSSLARGEWPAGEHVLEWGGKHEAGVYILRYRYPGGEQSRRLIRTG